MILAKKMITKLTKALNCDGYNIVQNNGEAAGQTVFHYHVHMIPRHKDDKVGLGWTMHELTEEEKEDVLSRIKQIKDRSVKWEKEFTEGDAFVAAYSEYFGVVYKRGTKNTLETIT